MASDTHDWGPGHGPKHLGRILVDGEWREQDELHPPIAPATTLSQASFEAARRQFLAMEPPERPLGPVIVTPAMYDHMVALGWDVRNYQRGYQKIPEDVQ